MKRKTNAIFKQFIPIVMILAPMRYREVFSG